MNINIFGVRWVSGLSWDLTPCQAFRAQVPWYQPWAQLLCCLRLRKDTLLWRSAPCTGTVNDKVVPHACKKMTAVLSLLVRIRARRCTKRFSPKCQSCKALKKFSIKHASIPTEANGGRLSQQHYRVLKWQINEDAGFEKVIKKMASV